MPEEVDRSERQEGAEADVESFEEQLGPFVVAVKTTRMPMVFTNAAEPDNPIIFANDSFLSLTGYERPEVLGQSFNFLMEHGADADALARIKAAFAGEGDDDDPEICYRRKDGGGFWASIFISPVRDENDQVVQHFVSFVDLTRHREERDHARMLIDELNHRVKNTLATVNSIVSQALRNSSDIAVVREAIEARLSALSRSHDLLTRRSWKSAGLLELVKVALEPFGAADGRAERFDITGADIRFPPKAVLAFGIAFHELATNAVKYGAFSNEAGRVVISWAVEPGPEGDRLILRWRERDGPPVAPPTRRGFGSRVIERGLAYELGGTVRLDYRPDGVVCTIDVPAPGGTGDE